MALPVSSILLRFHEYSFISLRWVSLIIVMAGVGLVGYSGSLIKDAIAGSPLPGLLGIKMDLAVSEPVEDTSVLIG